MSLAPHSVVWAFVLITIALVSTSLVWVVYHEPVAWLARRLWLGDLVAGWLAITAAYHIHFHLLGPEGSTLGGMGGVWVLCAALAVYGAHRLLPLPGVFPPAHRATVGLALALGIWGWSIGAGYTYIERLDADADLLAERPREALHPLPEAYAPLVRARFFFQVHSADRQLLERVLAPLERGQPLSEGMAALARLELVPQLLIHYDLERRRLHAYQIFQIVLLGGVLMAWGFGEWPRGREE